MNYAVQQQTLFGGITIAASGSVTTVPIVMNTFNPIGYFSLQLRVSGSGTCKIEPVYSNLIDSSGTPGTFYTADGASAIKTGITATSGPNSDGNIFIPTSAISVSLARFVAFKVTETGGANSVTVTLTVCYQ